mgnify:CR=1 FL=1
MQIQRTPHGFDWSCAKVECLASDEKKGWVYIKEPIEPWRYFLAVLTCTIWAVPSAFKTFGG